MPSTGNPPINAGDPNNPNPNPQPQPTPAAYAQPIDPLAEPAQAPLPAEGEE